MSEMGSQAPYHEWATVRHICETEFASPLEGLCLTTAVPAIIARLAAEAGEPAPCDADCRAVAQSLDPSASGYVSHSGIARMWCEPATLAAAAPGEVEDTVQERADRELEKIAEREKKSEEIKRRKKAQGKQAKKKPAAFEMTSDQGDLEKDATMRIRGYMKELDGIVEEAAESIAARGERAAERLKEDQPRTKELLVRLKVGTEELLGKVRAAGLNPDDSDAEVPEGLGEMPEEELRFWRTLPLMSNLSILQTQCRHVDAAACAQTLRVSRLALAVMRSEQKRLNLYKPTSAADAERYIGALDQWDQHIQAENERVAEEHTQVTDERLTIERKAKFADYIKAVKTQALRLDGDLDAQFEVKGKFQAAATKATTAAKAAPERPKPVDDVREQVLKRRAAPESDGESDGD